MVTDMRWKVRRSLAFSVHECAQILGPEVTESDLLPVIFHFLQDIVDVAEGALENLPQILQVLKNEQRDEYIELFIDAQNKVEKNNQAQWRQRAQLANQIKDFADLISAEKLHQFYVPKFFDFCLDDVAQVREEASTIATASIIKNLLKSGNQEYIDSFIDQMRLLKNSQTYTHRQSFCGMIQSIFCYEDPDLATQVLVKYFLRDIEDLSLDKVVNVRITLSEAFYKLIKKYQNLELSLSDKKITIKEKAIIEINIQQTSKILNKHFFKTLQNLKYDKSELVSEYLETLYVNPNQVQVPEPNEFLMPLEKGGRKFSILSSKQDSDFKRTFSHLIPDDAQRSES